MNIIVYQSMDTSQDELDFDDKNFLKNIINICNLIIINYPRKIKSIQQIIDRIELIVKLRIKEFDLIKHFDDKIGKVKVKIEDNLKEKNQNQNLRVVSDHDLFPCANPPNSILDAAILPTTDELKSSAEPFLRKNVINGSYESINHYLDVHYRLLREDFLQPLRQGIAQFRTIIKAHINNNVSYNEIKKQIKKPEVEKALLNIDGVKVYFDVKFSVNAYPDSATAIPLRLDPKRYKNIKWEHSKRLLFGALVCLSNDYFENNFIFAVVSDRNNEDLKKGIIKVKLENEESIDKTLLYNTADYVMFETTAYFEAYSYVLKALKSINFSDEEFPFSDHIIYSKNEDIKPPNYLTDSYVDLRTLVDQNKTVKIDEKNGTLHYIFDSTFDYAQYCSTMNENDWPTSQQMNLDQSQYESIKLALTKKIALIQGYFHNFCYKSLKLYFDFFFKSPPGTGKRRLDLN
jgi:hypothetical protein